MQLLNNTEVSQVAGGNIDISGTCLTRESYILMAIESRNPPCDCRLVTEEEIEAQRRFLHPNGCNNPDSPISIEITRGVTIAN